MSAPAKTESVSTTPNPTEAVFQQLSPERKALFSRLKTNKFVYSAIALVSFLFLASCSSTEATPPIMPPTLTALPPTQETTILSTPSPTADLEWMQRQAEATATAWSNPITGIENFNETYYEIPRDLRDATYLIKFYELDQNRTVIENMMSDSQEDWGATSVILTTEMQGNTTIVYGISNSHVVREAFKIDNPTHSAGIKLSQPQSKTELPLVTDPKNMFMTSYLEVANGNQDIAFFALSIPNSEAMNLKPLGLQNINPNWSPQSNETVYSLGFPVISGQNIIFPTTMDYVRFQDLPTQSDEVPHREWYFQGVTVPGASGSGIVDDKGNLLGVFSSLMVNEPTLIAQDLPSTFFTDFAKFQELAKQSMQPKP